MNFVWGRYVVIIVAGCAAVVALDKSFMFAILFLAFEVNRYLVPLMVKGKRQSVGILAWIGCLAGFAGLCYLLDFLLFPHSARSEFRARDAAVASLLGMVGGYFANWFDPSRRTKSHTQQLAETNL